MQPEAELRGLMVEQLAEQILAKPDTVAVRELQRVRLLRQIAAASGPCTAPRSRQSIQPPHVSHRMKCSASSACGPPTRPLHPNPFFRQWAPANLQILQIGRDPLPSASPMWVAPTESVLSAAQPIGMHAARAPSFGGARWDVRYGRRRMVPAS